MLCNGFDAFHSTVIIATSLLLEEPKRAKGYHNYYPYGSHLCNWFICGPVGYPGKQSIFHVFGLGERMLWGSGKLFLLSKKIWLCDFVICNCWLIRRFFCGYQAIAKFMALMYSYLNISVSNKTVPDEIKGREIHHSFPMTLFQVRSSFVHLHNCKFWTNKNHPNCIMMWFIYWFSYFR